MSKNLQDLIRKIDWVMIENKNFGSPKFDPNALKIKLMSSVKGSDRADVVQLAMGSELMKKIDIMIGDKLVFFHHPEDYCAFKAVKHATGKKVGKWGANISIGVVSFKWPHDKIPLKKTNSKETEYVIEDGSLIFRIEDNEE